MAVTENTTTNGSVVKTTRTGTATAQVGPAGSSGDAVHTAGTVDVNETELSIDQFVTNPVAANAVQVDGQGGESPLGDLPIMAAANGTVPHGGASL